MMQHTKGLTALLLAAILCLGLAACGGGGTEKQITVTITHLDGTVKTETMTTQADNLWDAMEEADLIQGKDTSYGKYVTAVDGETADESQEQWWCYTKSGEYVSTACDSTPIADGDAFEFVLTVGYTM